MYYLYRHIRLDTREVFYVGVGSKPNDKSIKRLGNTYKSEYYRAFDKCERNLFWNNIVNKAGYCVQIMFECNDYNAVLLKEREFIKLYGRRDLGLGTLVNMTDGGEGNQGILNLNTQVKVKCFDLDGSIFKHFNSVSEAAFYFNTKSHHISDCCGGKIRTFKGKIWRYEADNFNKFKIDHGKRKVIIQYDMNDNIIKEYTSITEAAKSIKGQESSISRALRGIRGKYRNFKWKYKESASSK